MAASANRRKQDDKNLEILRELISISGNKYCLDCNQRGPTYVNTTIGSFVCSKCSGMLRGLTPPHRVKSISMATFTPEEIELIKTRGNDYCKRVWLGLYEGESVNFADEQSVKDFMSDKYEKKRYYLEPSSTIFLTNGSSSSSKSKSRSKAKDSGSTAPLISIAAPLCSSNNNISINTAKVVNNLSQGVSVNPHKVARPANNTSVPLISSVNAVPAPMQPPVPNFPVDFSTANIYNGSQFNNVNNNFVTQSTNQAFNGFNSPPNTSSASNDRYAALADLDLALRQQNMKLKEDNTVNNKNPFQSNPTEVPSNRNPFFNGGWTATTFAPLPANPFMPSTNNGGFVNSNNPFL